MRYPVETFTTAELERLAPHFTNLQSPTYALTNMPESVKAAMFARYSRYAGSVKRLFLDEFAETLPPVSDNIDAEEGARASKLLDTVFVGYGDDSVAQLGGVHIAAEDVSNVLTKIIQRLRMASYLEKSTRYISFAAPIDDEGRRRFWRADGSVHAPALASAEYVEAMNEVFAIYEQLMALMTEWAAREFPLGDGEPRAAWERAINAKALDMIRGLLPAATLSNMGIYASGQAYENLVLHLLAHPLPEAVSYGEMMLAELNKVIPSFMARVTRDDRGGETIRHLQRRREKGLEWAERLGMVRDADPVTGSSVQLVSSRGSELDAATALLMEEVQLPESVVRQVLRDPALAEQVLADLCGDRGDRRHKAGRGLEAVSYRFEIVSDYGAFRDMQRHRLLTAQWQDLTPDLGYEMPPEIEAAGGAELYDRAMHIGRETYERIRETAGAKQAQYALPFAYRLRYTLDLNAREAGHVIELRSGSAGHPSYRAVALEMHRLISGRHPLIGAMMTHVDHTTDPRLERIQSEIRNEAKLQALAVKQLPSNDAGSQE